MDSFNKSRVSLLQTVSAVIFQLCPPRMDDVELLTEMQTTEFSNSNTAQSKLVVRLGSLITSYIVSNPKKLSKVPIKDAAFAISEVEEFKKNDENLKLQIQLIKIFSGIAIEMAIESQQSDLKKDAELITERLNDFKIHTHKL